MLCGETASAVIGYILVRHSYVDRAAAFRCPTLLSGSVGHVDTFGVSGLIDGVSQRKVRVVQHVGAGLGIGDPYSVAYIDHSAL